MATLSRWQYSLKALLVAMVVISICLALVARLGLLGAFLAAAFAGACVAALGLARANRKVSGLGGCLVVVVACILLIDTQCIAWVGHFTMATTVTVIDAETGRPIPDAAVWIDEEAFRPEDAVRADALGQAHYTAQWMRSGIYSHLGIMRPYKPYVVRLQSHAITVRAEGYESIGIRLSTATGREEWPSDGTPLPPFTVVLKPSDPP